MRTTLKYLTTIIILSGFIFFARPVSALEDAIIAIVNDDIVTLKDLKDFMGSQYMQLRMDGKTDSQIQEIMSELEISGIRLLIEDRLILSEANNIGIEIQRGRFNARWRCRDFQYEHQKPPVS